MQSKLNHLLTLSNIDKNSPFISSAVAIDDQGNQYYGVALKSKTKTMQICAIQSALLSAQQRGVVIIKEMYAYYPNEVGSNMFFDKKYLVDHASCFEHPINLHLNNRPEELVGSDLFDGYEADVGEHTNPSAPVVDKSAELMNLSIQAMNTSTSETKYGAVAVTNKDVYLSSQYSGCDNKSTIHAEIGAVMQAIIAEDCNINTISLVSNKFEEDLPVVCGSCLQFIAELSTYYGFDPQFELFSLSGSKTSKYKLGDLLTKVWDNKK